VHLVFLSLPNADLAVARVAERVRSGGHDVPEDVVRRRYAAGLRAFFNRYQEVVDTWQLMDNSDPSGPIEIASREPGQPPCILDPIAWNNLLERQR
jgi:predicted ABC-type ATPase